VAADPGGENQGERKAGCTEDDGQERVVVRGSQEDEGEHRGIEPTHREARTSICSVVRWRDGLAVEDHIYYDLYGSLAQLGQVPPLTADA
jgi:hypothetical protein